MKLCPLWKTVQVKFIRRDLNTKPDYVRGLACIARLGNDAQMTGSYISMIDSAGVAASSLRLILLS